MLHRLDTLDDIAQVYDPPGPIPLDKVVEQNDAHISAFMREATLVLANVRDADGNPAAVVIGGRPGFARVTDPFTASIEIPVESWPMGRLRPGRNTPYETGLLFVIPGIKETLRAKGRLTVAPTAEGSATLSATLSLDNSFFHCAKAFIRSHV
ncbi:hypothetical protein AB4144_40370, partial [Rhizobiaceae sp. 2RAB30]